MSTTPPRRRELPTLLRYREVAEELGVTERQVYNLADQDLLKRVKVGQRSVRITRDSLLKLMGQPAE